MINRLNAKYDLTWRTHHVHGEPYHLLQLVDFEQAVDRLIQQLAAAGQNDIVPEECPYFGQIWTSARQLANIVSTLDLSGKRVLEIGCGLALPSFVACKQGAVCSAVDIHPDVEPFLKANADKNHMADAIEFQRIDWRQMQADTTFDLIMGSDILYEKEHPKEVAQFLMTHLAPGGCAIIIDPCRWHHLEFVDALKEEQLHVDGKYSIDDEAGKLTKLFTMQIHRVS